jgi:propanol-preferring alcohol dehydrogenase
MRAARLHDYGQGFRIEEVPTPSPGPGEVVVRIAGAGFCHSDVHLHDGELRMFPRFPITPGHESAGFVAARGAGVTAVKDGDPVVVFGGWGCGTCATCAGGLEQLCSAPRWPGIFEDGGYAEYLRVPSARYLVPLTKLAPREAAPLADAALTPYRAIRLAAPHLVPDHPALVVGLGGLGEFGVRLLRALSGCPVIAIDVAEQKLQRARGLGADVVLDGRDKDVLERVMVATGGRGVCAAFDFVGSDATLDLCLRATRTRGKVTQLGLAGGTASMKVLQNTRFEVSFEATLWGSLQELREVVALVENGRVPNVPLEFAPLESIGDVLDRVRAGLVHGRVVVTP